MKKKLVLLVCSLTLVFGMYAQQFNGGTTLVGNVFNDALKSGFYNSLTSPAPSVSWPYSYRYLLNMRINEHDNSSLYEFQISTAYVDDDRVFFRKVYPYGAGLRAGWIEFATRGVNKFKGNQYVNGALYANEINVEPTTWADFVFSPNYNLRPLSEVKSHIQEHKHLPDLPSEKQVLEEGINVADMQAKLLQKIEELTLYIIQQQDEITKLNNKLVDIERLNK